MTCPRCSPALPTPDELRLHASGKRLYAALQSDDLTAGALRKLVWDDRVSEFTVPTLIDRLDRKLTAFGFTIARIGTAGKNRKYRVVAL